MRWITRWFTRAAAPQPGLLKEMTEMQSRITDLMISLQAFDQRLESYLTTHKTQEGGTTHE